MKPPLLHTVKPVEQAGVVLLFQWAEFCRLRTVVLSGGDVEAIHDLRVASRRLRATLALLAPYLPGKSTKRFARKIRAITGALGHVRNIDEALLYFRGRSAPVPKVTAGLEKLRKKAFRAVVRILEKFSCQDRECALQTLVERLTAQLTAKGAQRALLDYLQESSSRRHRQVLAQMAAAGGPENVEGRHRFRIAIKKWRYLLETVGLITGGDYDELLTTLKSYQTVLGTLNDMVTFAALCRGLKLSADEKKAVRAALNADTASNLAAFGRLLSRHPLDNAIPQ